MNLLDQFDAKRMDSEEDNSEQEDMNNKNSGEQKLVVNFDLNYDIRGAKDARADILDRLAIGAANSEESGSHLQFDHQNSDADSYRDMEAAEKEHMAMNLQTFNTFSNTSIFLKLFTNVKVFHTLL